MAFAVLGMVSEITSQANIGGTTTVSYSLGPCPCPSVWIWI